MDMGWAVPGHTRMQNLEERLTRAVGRLDEPLRQVGERIRGEGEAVDHRSADGGAPLR
jgi:hypothetical protein